MALNALYEDELSYLRELGSEFARANPKLGAFLGPDANDPDVERLLEGFAFLTARLRQRLDDELPEVSHALTRLIWPHYLRPIPPMTMLRFEPQATGPGKSLMIPAGTRVRARLVNGVSCSFATTQSLELLPVALGEVEVESLAASARLRFKIRSHGKGGLSVLGGSRLRLFVGTERDPQIGRTLILWLLRHVRQITATAEGGARLSLRPSDIVAGGFGDDEALLPWPGNTFSGFRLLQEYLTYPAKFMFVEIGGLGALPTGDARTVSIAIEFDRPFPPQFRLIEDQIRPNCVPALNLFPHDAEPIRLDGTRTEYRVVPLGATGFSIHAIDGVVGYRQGRSERRTYEPFESFRHDLPGERSDRSYVRERLRPSVVGRGADTYVSFVDRLGDTVETAAEVVSIKLICSNGPLAERLAIGSVDQPTGDLPSGVSVSNITTVTAEIPAPIGDNLLWRLVANLARNYASLSSVDGLRSALAAYDFQAVHDLQARRRLALLMEALRSVTVDTRDTVVRGIPARLRHLTLSVEEGKIGGEAELHLLGAVLNAFFASYMGINSLHQFAIRGLDSKAAFSWPARFGSGGAP